MNSHFRNLTRASPNFSLVESRKGAESLKRLRARPFSHLRPLTHLTAGDEIAEKRTGNSLKTLATRVLHGLV